MMKEPLGDRLRMMIRDLPQTQVPLVTLIDGFGSDSLALISILLALVFVVPVSIPGVSTVFGGAILLIGLAQLFGRALWLPQRMACHAVSTEKLAPALKRALTWFQRLEKVSQPYRLGWLASPQMNVFNHLALILSAVLLMVPFSFIPFSNTLPALAVIFFALGELEKDGVCILLGHMANLATLFYFTVLITGGGLAILEGLHAIV